MQNYFLAKSGDFMVSPLVAWQPGTKPQLVVFTLFLCVLLFPPVFSLCGSKPQLHIE